MACLLDTQPEIKDFLDAENPSLAQIVKAYSMRDNILNLDKDEVFNNSMKKLGLHPDFYESSIDMTYRRLMIGRIDEFLKDKKMPIVCIDYCSFRLNLINTKYQGRLTKYNMLFEMKDNMESVYNALSKEDLYALGW